MPVARKSKYGWVPDIPDRRDLTFASIAPKAGPLPSRIDLRANMPPVYNQGDLGSCVAQAIVANAVYCLKKQAGKTVTPSRLFLYFNARVFLGTEGTDSGAMIRDGIKTMAKEGSCAEVMWPYRIKDFTRKPPDKCYQEALEHQAMKYYRLPTANIGMARACLAAGFPFVFGMAVYESFESEAVAKSGVVPMPLPTETMLGGHAVLGVGYNDDTKQLVVRNSWGDKWGQSGYFLLPYEFVQTSDYVDDFWTIRLMEA